MRKVLIFGAALILVLGLAIAAQAVTINDPWPLNGVPEMNLYQIVQEPLFGSLSNYGSSTNFANSYPIMETLPVGSYVVDAYAKYAAFTQNPGFYPAGNSAALKYFSPTYTPIFPVGNNGIYATNFVFSSDQQFGFFDDNTANGAGIKYTQLDLNWNGDLGQSNGLIFQISPTHWIVAFEDGAGANSLGDADYNDLVLDVRTPVPPSILLMGSGLLGVIGLRFMRKRS